MKVVIKDGLLWRDDTSNKDNIIGCIEADKIANANGFIYVERLIKEYRGGTVLRLDNDLKIVSN